MPDFKIGVIIDSFGVPFEEAIKKAAAIGAEGIQLYATSGRMAPENLNAAQRKEILDYITSNGLEVAAVCGDLGGHGFIHAADNPKKVEKSKRIIELALELGTNVVTTHIGVVPDDKASEKYRVLHDACKELGDFAEKNGAYFAIETGPEPAETLGAFIESLGNKGIAVNLDPANLIMVTGDDPVKAVHTLKNHIVHTHAKDGVMLRKVSPLAVYEGLKEPGGEGPSYKEVPLGQGSVDFKAYLVALKTIGYKGYLTIERETGKDPAADIAAAVNFLRALI